jgi:hypothetical protein
MVFSHHLAIYGLTPVRLASIERNLERAIADIKKAQNLNEIDRLFKSAQQEIAKLSSEPQIQWRYKEDIKSVYKEVTKKISQAGLQISSADYRNLIKLGKKATKEDIKKSLQSTDKISKELKNKIAEQKENLEKTLNAIKIRSKELDQQKEKLEKLIQLLNTDEGDGPILGLITDYLTRIGATYKTNLKSADALNIFADKDAAGKLKAYLLDLSKHFEAYNKATTDLLGYAWDAFIKRIPNIEIPAEQGQKQ